MTSKPKLNKAFIICSRSDSSRLPNKPHRLINGIPLLQHLISRCLMCDIPVIVAVPHRDIEDYKYIKTAFKDNVYLFYGNAKDPLMRMKEACIEYGVDTAIRVAHDKIFIDPIAVRILDEHREREQLDYVYSSSFIDGSSFEFISFDSLNKASDKYKNVEFIGYAVRCVTDKIKSVDLSKLYKSDHRLLIDYPEDLEVMELVLHTLGNDCTLKEALLFLDQRPWIAKKNKTPKITIYTCAYNGEKWLSKAMGSVSEQRIFGDCEYILVDDHSSDGTPIIMSKFCSSYRNAKWIRNEENKGLASSSNIALTKARGRFIMRLDADDYFPHNNVLEEMYYEAEHQKVDILYPDNYFGSYDKIQKADENHHVGGALFRTRAANHVKFTDGLRGHDSLDFFIRAREQMRVGYINKPMFFYRQHAGSLSKNNLAMRDKLKDSILNGPK